jgi:sugar/nucleoside kinase (ribokinase family)
MALQLAEYCDIAAVKVGAQGSFIARSGEVERIDPMHAAQVVDTTGAGDLWAAGFLYGWSRKRPLTECGAIGSILGAAVVQEQGSALPEHVWQDILSQI